MKKRDIRFASIPSTEEVAAERERLAYQNRYQRVLRSTVYILVVVAAAAGYAVFTGASGLRRQHEPYVERQGHYPAGKIQPY